jgi:hypothetical protein
VSTLSMPMATYSVSYSQADQAAMRRLGIRWA